MYLDLVQLQTLLSTIAPLMAKAKKEKFDPTAYLRAGFHSELVARHKNEAIRAYFSVSIKEPSEVLFKNWPISSEVYEYLTKLTPNKSERWVFFNGAPHAYTIEYNGVATKTFSYGEEADFYDHAESPDYKLHTAQNSHQVTTLQGEEAATFVRTFSKAQYTDDMGLAPNLKCIGLTTYGGKDNAQFQTVIGKAVHSAVFFNTEQPFNATEGVTDMRKDERPLVKVPYLVADVLAQKSYSKTKVEQLHFRAERIEKEKLPSSQYQIDYRTYISSTEAHLSNGLTVIIQSETTDARWPINGLTSACKPETTYAKSTLLPLFREHLLAALKNPLAKAHKDFLVHPAFHPKWSGTLTFKQNLEKAKEHAEILFTMNGDYLDGAFDRPAHLQEGTDMAFNARILSEALEILPIGHNVTAKFPNEEYGQAHIFESGPLWVIVMPIHTKN